MLEQVVYDVLHKWNVRREIYGASMSRLDVNILATNIVRSIKQIIAEERDEEVERLEDKLSEAQKEAMLVHAAAGDKASLLTELRNTYALIYHLIKDKEDFKMSIDDLVKANPVYMYESDDGLEIIISTKEHLDS